MKGTLIAIFITVWIAVAVLLFINFVGKSMKQKPVESSISSSDMLGEQREKAQQAREDQKRAMEDLKRRIQDQQRR